MLLRLVVVFALLAAFCHGQAQQGGQSAAAKRFPENVQVYFPKISAKFEENGEKPKKIFLVNRGRVSFNDGNVVMALGKTFSTSSPLIKVVAKILTNAKSEATRLSTVEGLTVTLTAEPLGPGAVDVNVVAVGLASIGHPVSRLTAKQPLIAASGRTLEEDSRAKGEFNISVRCGGYGDALIKLTLSVESLPPPVPRTPPPEVYTFIKRRCGMRIPELPPATTDPSAFATHSPDEGPSSSTKRQTPPLVKYSAGIAAVALVLIAVFSIVIYLWCQSRDRRRKAAPSTRVEFDIDSDTAHFSCNGKKTSSSKSKNGAEQADEKAGHGAVRQQDSLSYGDVQSNVHTQRSTLSGVTNGVHVGGNGDDGEDDERDDRDDGDEETHGQAAANAQAIAMHDTGTPASLNSDASMSSVAPLITVHATYPWQYHSVFHGCIIDKDRIQIGQIVKQGSYGQVFEGTLGYPERLPIIVKTSTQSAHQDEIQRFAFEAMVMKGAVHKYVHSVVGICFASTATNGVPVPPFLIFPMVPGQKSLKDLLLHTRRVAGIRDSGTDGGNGSVGRAGGKMLSTPQLVMMAAQIARGLRHLEKRNIVHKDVATRNCIVLPNLEVRIGDAALSCDLYPNEYHYHFNFGHAKVPLKWMPLECIEDGLFSGNSDVWSFGIAMWEIMTLGSLPFEDIDELELSHHLQNGHRLPQPRRCPFELFAIMARCWALSPEDRPGFGFLVHGLYTYADSLRCYI